MTVNFSRNMWQSVTRERINEIVTSLLPIFKIHEFFVGIRGMQNYISLWYRILSCRILKFAACVASGSYLHDICNDVRYLPAH